MENPNPVYKSSVSSEQFHQTNSGGIVYKNINDAPNFFQNSWHHLKSIGMSGNGIWKQASDERQICEDTRFSNILSLKAWPPVLLTAQMTYARSQ